jgi:hypothetical protein
MGRYSSRFAARALKLFDDLAAAGLVDSNERFSIQYPTNPLGIARVAEILGVAGEGGVAKQSVWRKVKSRL